MSKRYERQKASGTSPDLQSDHPNLKDDAYLPETTNNILTIADYYDVPTFKKPIVQEGFHSHENSDSNYLFLNNLTNI